jgi:TolB-like protein
MVRRLALVSALLSALGLTPSNSFAADPPDPAAPPPLAKSKQAAPGAARPAVAQPAKPAPAGKTPAPVAKPPAAAAAPPAPADPPPKANLSPAKVGEKRRARIALLEVKALAGVSDSTATVLTELIATQIGQLQRYDVISRADIQSMLGFQLQRKMLGCTDDAACVAEIGGALGADYILSGQVGQFGVRYRLSVTLQDVKRAKVVSRQGAFCDRTEDALGVAAQEAVANVIRELEGGGALPPPMVKKAAEPPPDPPGVKLRSAGLWVGGIGVAGLAAGGVFDALAYQAYQDEKKAAAAGDAAAFDASKAKAHSRATAAKALYVGGAVTAGTGLLLWWLGGRQLAAAPPPVAIAIQPLQGGALATLSGRLP